VNHPVLAVGLKQDVAALELLSVEDDHDLAVGEFLRLVRSAVPDQDLSGAVVPCGNVAVKVDVIEWVILDVDREVICLGVQGHAFRDRP